MFQLERTMWLCPFPPPLFLSFSAAFSLSSTLTNPSPPLPLPSTHPSPKVACKSALVHVKVSHLLVCKIRWLTEGPTELLYPKVSQDAISSISEYQDFLHIPRCAKMFSHCIWFITSPHPPGLLMRCSPFCLLGITICTLCEVWFLPLWTIFCN